MFKRKLYVFTVLTVVGMGMFGSLLVPQAHATQMTDPYIHTTKTAHGVTVQMDLPNNFKGQVYTVYKNGAWQSYATSTPLTKADMSKIDNQIKAEQTAMDQLFAEQQKLFEQQQVLLQQAFGSSLLGGSWW